MLFYIDRQTLSVLKTTLKGEFGWTDADYGLLVSAFMASYTVCYLVSGRWIDRWGTRRTMPFFIGLMSLATLFCGFSRSLGEMAAFRVALGIAEAGIVPAVLVAIVTWFPPTRRGTASTIKEPINIAGQIIATPLAVGIVHLWGWRWAFFAPGVLGIFIAIGWWLTDRNPPAQRLPAGAAEEPAQAETYLQVLKRREIWGVIFARMISDPMWFFLLYWEPGFLQEKLGMSLTQLGRVGWIPTAVATVSLISLGAFSDRLIIKLGWAPAKSRRVLLQFLAFAAPSVLVLPFVTNHALAIALLCVARVMMIVWLNFSNLLMADLVPRRTIGTAVALMSAVGAGTSLLSNAFIGPIVDAVGYTAIFVVGACLHPLAAVILWRCYGERRRHA
jgi:ACS family hexuronate transporter-like MFS transporter